MTWAILLAYIAPMVLWVQYASDDMNRIQEAQAVVIEEQNRIEEEKRIIQEKEKDLEETMTEWFLSWLDTLEWIRYRLGRFDIESNAFDCVWLFKAYAVMRWLLTVDEAKYINSYVMANLGKDKQLYEAVRWDVTYWKPLWDYSRHIAFVSRDYNEDDGWLWIVDSLDWDPKERFIRLRRWIYIGKRKVSVKSSPFVEIALNKWLEYEPLRNYEWVYNLSRYYSPMPGQDKYYLWQTYEQDLAMNTSWNPLVTADWTTLDNSMIEKIIACPPEYPLGTTFMIEDWIEVRCADRWWSIKWKRLDIRAGIGMQWLDNIEHNKVVTWRRNIYRKTLHSKPINEPTKSLRILDSRGNYSYINIRN